MNLEVPGSSIRLDLLREFVEFSHSLNFSSTARELKISQSALSKHMSDLERELGLKLIDRGYKQKLTPAGKEFASRTLMMLHEYRRMVNDCLEIQQADSFTIRMQEPIILDPPYTLIIGFIQSYAEDNRDVTLRLIPNQGKSAESLIVSDQIDLDFIVSYGDPQRFQQNLIKKEMVALPVMSQRYIIWASMNNPLIARDHLSLDDIADERIVMPANNEFDYFAFCAQSMFDAKKLQSHIEILTVDTMSEFLTAPKVQDRIYLLPESYAQHPLVAMHSGMACKVIEDPACIIDYYIVFKSTPPNDSFRDFIIALDDFLKSK